MMQIPTCGDTELQLLANETDLLLNEFAKVDPFDWWTKESFEEYLEGTSFTESRKMKYRAAHRRWNESWLSEVGAGCLGSASFIKMEMLFKEMMYQADGSVGVLSARTINQVADMVRTVIIAPVVHKIEKIFFGSRYAVKYMNVQERLNYLINIFKGTVSWYETDHSAFEAHMTERIKLVIEWRFFRGMVSVLPHMNYLVYVFRQLCKPNSLRGNGLSFVGDCRCSGDLMTSLGNSITNLVVFRAACRRKGVTRVNGVVEGDDGIFECQCGLEPSDFTSFGFDVKIKRHTQLYKVGFCSLHWDWRGNMVLDPKKFLMKLGWTHSSLQQAGIVKRVGLLVGKCRSLLYLAPVAPIISRLCWKILDLLPDVKAIYDDVEYYINVGQITNVIREPVPDSARVVVEELFGYSVRLQLDIEGWISKMGSVQPLPSWFVPASYLNTEMWSKHVTLKTWSHTVAV